MQALVWVRGELDPDLLWAYHPRYLPSPGGVLSLDVHDAQDLVAALLTVSSVCEVRRVRLLGRGHRPRTGPRRRR